MSSYEDQLKYYADYCTWFGSGHTDLNKEELFIEQIIRDFGYELYKGSGLGYIKLKRNLNHYSFLQSFLINDLPISYESYGIGSVHGIFWINGLISEDHKSLTSFEFEADSSPNFTECQITNFTSLNKFIIKNMHVLESETRKGILNKNDTYYTYSFSIENFKDIKF